MDIRPRRQGSRPQQRTRADNVVVLILLFIVMGWAAGMLVAFGLCVGAATGDRTLAAQIAASADLA